MCVFSWMRYCMSATYKVSTYVWLNLISSFDHLIPIAIFQNDNFHIPFST